MRVLLNSINLPDVPEYAVIHRPYSSLSLQTSQFNLSSFHSTLFEQISRCFLIVSSKKSNRTYLFLQVCLSSIIFYTRLTSFSIFHRFGAQEHEEGKPELDKRTINQVICKPWPSDPGRLRWQFADQTVVRCTQPVEVGHCRQHRPFSTSSCCSWKGFSWEKLVQTNNTGL